MGSAGLVRVGLRWAGLGWVFFASHQRTQHSYNHQPEFLARKLQYPMPWNDLGFCVVIDFSRGTAGSAIYGTIDKASPLRPVGVVGFSHFCSLFRGQTV